MVVPNLNVVQVPVASKERSLLMPALQQAFADVLVKYSGNPDVMSLPDVQAAVRECVSCVPVMHVYRLRYSRMWWTMSEVRSRYSI